MHVAPGLLLWDSRGTGPPLELKLPAAIAQMQPPEAAPPPPRPPEAGLSLSQVWKALPGLLLTRTVQLSVQDRGASGMGSVLGRGGQQGTRKERSVESRLEHLGGSSAPSLPQTPWLSGCTKPPMPDPQALLPAASPEQLGTRPAPSLPGSPQPVRGQHPARERRGQDLPPPSLGSHSVREASGHVIPAGGIRNCPVRVSRAPALKPLLFLLSA